MPQRSVRVVMVPAWPAEQRLILSYSNPYMSLSACRLAVVEMTAVVAALYVLIKFAYSATDLLSQMLCIPELYKCIVFSFDNNSGSRLPVPHEIRN